MDEFWDTRDSVLPPDFQELLQNYSQISPEDQIEHIKKIRTKAWKVKQYPCIGSYMFLDLSMKDHSAYAEVLASLRSSKDATLLDLGCCIGQDLRKLAFDGVPGDQLVGYDIEPGFFQVGYEAFQDKRHFQAGFVAGDFLASKGETSEEHRQDQYRFVHAAYFFHLWSWKKQVEAYTKAVLLLRDEPGCILFGRNTGVVSARLLDEGPFARPDENQDYTWLHDGESMARMTKEVEAKSGRQLQVSIEEREVLDDKTLKLKPVVDLGWTKRLDFTIRTI